MSYATGTTHYNLPQTVGTDKRDWFDTNQAFSDIDAAIYGAVQTAETAEADLTSITTRVGNLETDVASLETTTDTHSSNISALQTSVTQLNNAVTDNKQDILDMIESTQEASATATYAHAVGSYFIYNDTLYVTTVAIAVGDTIVPNTNCETTDVGTVLSQLNSTLSNVQINKTNVESEASYINPSSIASVMNGELFKRGDAVYMDIQFQTNITDASTVAIGSIPDANFRPNIDLNFGGIAISATGYGICTATIHATGIIDVAVPQNPNFQVTGNTSIYLHGCWLFN